MQVECPNCNYTTTVVCPNCASNSLSVVIDSSFPVNEEYKAYVLELKSYEMYAITHNRNGYKTTYTHQVGKPLPMNPGGFECEVIELIGNELDVLRPFVGHDPSHKGCSYACKEDGSCGYTRMQRLSKFNRNSLRSVPEEVLRKVHRYYEHIYTLYEGKTKPSYEQIRDWYQLYEK